MKKRIGKQSLFKKRCYKSAYIKKENRFWNAPDNDLARKTFMQLQVDYINTDDITELASILNKK